MEWLVVWRLGKTMGGAWHMRSLHRGLSLRSLAGIGLVALLSACAAEPSGREGSVSQSGAQPVAASGEEAEEVFISERYHRYVRYAEQAERKHKFMMAATLYRRAHAEAPDQLLPLVKLATIFKAMGHWAQAAEAYRRATVLEGGDSEMLVDYGVLLLAMDQPDRARLLFSRALDLGESAALYNVIAVAYDVSGDHTSAQAYYRVALELEPDNLAAKSNLGLSFALSGAYDSAIKVLKAAVADPRAKLEHRRMLATAYALAGDRQMAAEVGGPGFDEAAAREMLKRYSAGERLHAAGGSP